MKKTAKKLELKKVIVNEFNTQALKGGFDIKHTEGEKSTCRYSHSQASCLCDV